MPKLHLILISIFLTTPLFAQNRWENIEGFQEGDVLCDIVRGDNGRLVAVGYGAILLSEDSGLNWEAVTHTPPVQNWEITSIAYGEGRFALSDRLGIYTSEDGRNWTIASEQGGIAEMYYLGGKFIGLSGAETFVVSEDGITWEPNNHGHNTRWHYTLAYDGGKFLIESDAEIAWSTDARSWNWFWKPPEMVPSGYSTSPEFSGFFYHSDAFWKYGLKNYRSEDGFTWTEFAAVPDFVPVSLTSFRGILVAVTDDSIFTSEDGYTWDLVKAGIESIKRIYADPVGDQLFILGGILDRELRKPYFDRQNFRLFSVGKSIAELHIPQIPVSEDAEIQTLVSHSSGLYADVGEFPLMRSTNGLDWEEVKLGNEDPVVAFLDSHEGRLYAQFRDHSFAYSEDALTWTYAAEPPTGKLYDIHYAEDIYVAAGIREFRGPYAFVPLSDSPAEFESSPSGTVIINKAAMYASEDGNIWQLLDIPLSAGPLSQIAYGNGVFLAVGGTSWYSWQAGGYFTSRNMIKSEDGITWETINPDLSEGKYQSAVYFNGAFYVADGSSSLLRSENATDWESVPVEGIQIGKLFIDSHDELIAAGSSSVIAGSSDGLVWTLKNLPAGSELGMGESPAISDHDGYYYLGGIRGFQLRSPNNGFWPAAQADGGWSNWSIFGWMWEEAHGTSIHTSLGWIMILPSDLTTDDFYWYSPSWGWSWMRNSWLPWHYRIEDSSWLYQLDSTNWFFNTTTNSWENCPA